MEASMYQRKTWLDIDLDAIRDNYRTACSLTSAKVFCVIKSNAYGHGLVRIAQELQDAGCCHFAVSCGREAILLRKNGITGDILVMGVSEDSLIQTLVAQEITLAVSSVDELRLIHETAEALRKKAIVHIKIDTGFHRLGFPCTEDTVAELCSTLASMPWIDAEGLFSHLGLINRELDEKQHATFERMISLFQGAGKTFSCLHLCDSIGLVRYPKWHYHAVRVGAFLFGARPFRTDHMPFVLTETIAFRSRITRIHTAEAGEVIGYGDDQIFDHPVRVATLSVGYGDGYPRRLSNGKGKVLIHGQSCGVIGLVCMDQMMVDITDVPDAQVGDIATMLGDGISYLEYAQWANTNRNEGLAALSSRPLRIYHKQNRIVSVSDELLGERVDFTS